MYLWLQREKTCSFVTPTAPQKMQRRDGVGVPRGFLIYYARLGYVRRISLTRSGRFTCEKTGRRTPCRRRQRQVIVVAQALLRRRSTATIHNRRCSVSCEKR